MSYTMELLFDSLYFCFQICIHLIIIRIFVIDQARNQLPSKYETNV